MAVNLKFSSGATSSVRRPDYSSVSREFLHKLAARFSLGEIRHGRGNWKRAWAGPDGAIDIDFLRDRYNHAVEHLMMLREGTANDDHIGAVGWFLCFATEAEQVGVDWADILMVRTPEEEAEWRDKFRLRSRRKR